MKLFQRSLIASLLVLAVTSTSQATDVTDPAELFPADTLAYAELHELATVAPQLAALFKGTPLEDSFAFIDGRRNAARTPHDLTGKPELAILGLLATPELAAELKKLRGAAAGLTGFTSRGEPQGAVAVLTGDSPAVGLAARAFLTMSTVRKVAAVGDVPVYQFRQPSFTYDPNDGRQKLANDKPPSEGPYEATFAYTPGVFVVGTNREAVGDVVTRFQGKGKGSLASHPAFKEAAASYRKPGAFYFANVPEFCTKYDAARANGLGSAEPDAYGWFKLIVNAKSVRYLTGSAGYRNGGLAVSLGGAFDPAQKSPLFDLLSGPGTKVELLHHAPTPATVAVALTLPEKDRATTVIGFLDAIAKANGELGRLPGEAVREMEAKYKLSISNELLGKVQSMTIALPAKQTLSKGAVSLPTLVLHTEGTAAAAAWEDFLPKLVADLNKGELPQPSLETINGVKVLSLPGTGLPWKSAIHYARKDSIIIIGLDRSVVAAAASLDGARAVAGLNAVAVAQANDKPALVGAVGLGPVLRALSEPSHSEGPAAPAAPALRAPGNRLRDEEAAETEQKESEEKAWVAFLKAVEGLPPATLTVHRVRNELKVEVWQSSVQGGGPTQVVTAGVEWFDKLLDRGGNPNGYQFNRIRRFRK